MCSQVGKTCKLLQGPDTQQAALNALNASLEAKRSLKISLINYTRDGEPFHNAIECGPVEGGSHFVATISSTPIKDGSVAPLPVPMSALVPEAERGPSEPVCYVDRARKRPKRSSERLKLLDVMANQDDPIVLCSNEYPYVITHPNQAWLEMCGYGLEEVEGMTNSILTGPETDQSAIERIMRNTKLEKPSVETIVNYKKGGQKFLNQVPVRPCCILFCTCFVLSCLLTLLATVASARPPCCQFFHPDHQWHPASHSSNFQVHVQPVYDENDELAAFMSLLTEVDEGM